MSAGVGAGTGTGVLEEGGRIDAVRLRDDRRRRCFDAMADHGLDCLVLGRESNARFAAGARRLWTEGTRPFGPGCVVVQETGAVHLLSSWDDGIPPEVGHDHLFGITWNGATLFATLAGIPGLASSRRIGVDGMTPGMAQLIATLAPGAEIVDATGALASARRIKAPDELACIRTAVAIAEAGLSAAVDHLRPGVSTRALGGIATARMADLGVTVPDREASFTTTSPPLWPGQPQGDVALGVAEFVDAGSLVSGHLGVLYLGYEGVASRTWRCPDVDGVPKVRSGALRKLEERLAALSEQLVSACRPGGRGSDLLAAYETLGEPLPGGPVAHGVGLGMEPPLIGAALPEDAGAAETLEAGMALFVTASVHDGGVGTLQAGHTVHVTEHGPALMSRLAHLTDPGEDRPC